MASKCAKNLVNKDISYNKLRQTTFARVYKTTINCLTANSEGLHEFDDDIESLGLKESSTKNWHKDKGIGLLPD